MRGMLLWAAQNPWLAAHLPRWRFARRAVKRFMPGEGFDAALTSAVDFRTRGIGAVFTLLGENLTSLEDADRVVQHYEEVLAATTGVEAEISVKPTQLGLDIDADAAYANLERTVELYRRLRTEHSHVGVALQAYLHRTVSDVVSLLPLRPAIRLVKGAYAETAEIAFTGKREVDANFLALTVLMVTEVKRRRLR